MTQRQRSGRFNQSWRGGVFFSCDFHVATCHRGDATNMRAADKVAEEGGTKVAAGMKTSQDEVWIASQAVFFCVIPLLTDRLDAWAAAFSR